MEPNAVAYDPFDPAVLADPYPSYRELRERAPVYETAAGFYAVARHEDVLAVLRNPAGYSSSAMNFSATRPEGSAEARGRLLIAADPPVHTRLRGLINRAFTSRRVAELEPRIRHLVAGMLDGALPRGEWDLVSDLAGPLPTTVIAEMLGIDPERREDFKRWSDDVVAIAGGMPDEAEMARLQRSLPELDGYLDEVIAERRRAPRSDLVSALIEASEDGAVLSPEDVRSLGVLLLIAGNETTTNLVGNAVLALDAHPDAAEAVRKNPALVANLVEEALRWDSPVQAVFRQTTREVELAGTKLPEGALVLGLLGSANRDERRFPDPDRFDVRRDATGHVAFGFGVHFCLGAPLARLEAKVVLESLFARTRSFRVAGAPERIHSFFLRGLRGLPVRSEVV